MVIRAMTLASVTDIRLSCEHIVIMLGKAGRKRCVNSARP